MAWVTKDIGFIHSNLNYLGLSPHQFRVYCYFLGWAKGCSHSKTVIARHCKISNATVARCIQELIDMGLIRKEIIDSKILLKSQEVIKINSLDEWPDELKNKVSAITEQ